MKYYLITFTIVFTVFISYSCKHEKKCHEELNLNVDVMNVISAYIEEHPQYNTFYLESTKRFAPTPRVFTQGFLLGPDYKPLIEKYNPKFYFDVSGKRVFYMSYIDELIQNEKSDWIIENQSDSISRHGWIYKDSPEVFLYRSIYFYYNRFGSLEVNFRPDTVFLGTPIEDESEVRYIPPPQ